MTYYTLVSRNPSEGSEFWAIEFGDYCKATVEYERSELRYQYPKGEFKILVTGDGQADIDRAVDALNSAIRSDWETM